MPKYKRTDLDEAYDSTLDANALRMDIGGGVIRFRLFDERMDAEQEEIDVLLRRMAGILKNETSSLESQRLSLSAMVEKAISHREQVEHWESVNEAVVYGDIQNAEEKQAKLLSHITRILDRTPRKDADDQS